MSEVINKIEISVKTQYLPEYSNVDDSHFVFAYTITIKNCGNIAAKLLSRHWIITDANGDVHEIRGVGVVGKQPLIQPGKEYQYTSSAAIATPIASMQGSYHMVNDNNQHFNAEIPIFSLSAPNMIN